MEDRETCRSTRKTLQTMLNPLQTETPNSRSSVDSSLPPSLPREPSPPSPVGLVQEPADGSSGQRSPIEHAAAHRRRNALLSLIDELSMLHDEEDKKEKLQEIVQEKSQCKFAQPLVHHLVLTWDSTTFI